MAGSLHGSARTTPRVRAELQASKDTSGALARRYGLSRTTVAKWRARTTTQDAPMGPSSPHSTGLTPAEEAMIVEFRRRTLLPLDDVLGCLGKALLPPPNHRTADVRLGCDPLHGTAARRDKDNLGPLNELALAVAVRHHRLQKLPVRRTHDHAYCLCHTRRLARFRHAVNRPNGSDH
jgi:hypothetical protein